MTDYNTPTESFLAYHFDPAMERGVQRCIADVLEDKQSYRGWFKTYRWHRNWRQEEMMLCRMGGMFGSVNWMILKESLNRIGGFW